MGYDVARLRLEGIAVKEITACRIVQECGEHGELTLTAWIEEDVIEEAEELQPLRLYLSGGQEKNLFCGVLMELTQKETGGLLQIMLRAKSYSYLMDIRKKSRSFQDASMTYAQLIRLILGEYGAADAVVTSCDIPVGTLCIQYQETDWQFLKRMFSTLYAPLACEIGIPAIRIYAGVPALEDHHFNYEVLDMTLDFQECDFLKETGYELMESDALLINVRTDRLCGLFSPFSYQETAMAAAGVYAALSKGVLVTEARLKRARGIAQAPVYPMQLVGLALEGTVLEVKGESVRLHLAIDGDSLRPDVHWFPYSTPSASPDGSGWYYMPEAGDRLRVYFPTKYMKDALAISSVGSYEGKGGPDRMADPNTKYLRSASGQELNMGGSGVRLSSSEDAASLSVGSDGKITAKGKQIQVVAEESIEIMEAANVRFHSMAGAVYKCSQGGGTELDSSGNLLFKGCKFHVD